MTQLYLTTLTLNEFIDMDLDEFVILELTPTGYIFNETYTGKSCSVLTDGLHVEFLADRQIDQDNVWIHIDLPDRIKSPIINL